MSHHYTSDDLATGIERAMKARDFEAVVDLLKALVGVDPHRASLIYDTLQVGIALAGES